MDKAKQNSGILSERKIKSVMKLMWRTILTLQMIEEDMNLTF